MKKHPEEKAAAAIDKPKIGLAFPVYLVGNKLKGHNADKLVTIEAPHKVLKTIIQFADGFHTLAEIADKVPAKYDRKKVKALLQALHDRKILIPNNMRLAIAWAWVRNPSPDLTEVPLGLPERLERLADKKMRTTPKAGKIFHATPDPVTRLLQKRCTSREFSGVPLRDQELVQLLYAAYGVLDLKTNRRPNGYARRTVASGGGIYPSKLTWVNLKGTKKLKAGVYDIGFGPRRSVTFKLISSDTGRLFRALIDPVNIMDAHGVLFVSADLGLMQLKYGNRSFLLALLEAGHIAQNLTLEALQLGKGVWEIAGFFEDQVQTITRLADCEPLLALAIGNIPSHKSGAASFSKAHTEFKWLTFSDPANPSFHIGRARIQANGKQGLWSWGRSADPVMAVRKTVGEAIERFACDDFSNFVWTRPASLLGFVGPKKFVRYADASYRRENFPYHKFNPQKRYPCTRVHEALSGKPTWVLADHICFNSGFNKKYLHPYTSASTSGAAAYPTEEGAIERALLEVIERDMFMRTWLSRMAPQQLNNSSLPQALQKRLVSLRRDGWNIHLLVLGMEPATTILIFAQNKKLGMAQATASCHFDPATAVTDTFEEMEGTFPTLSIDQGKSPLTPEQVLTPEDHSRLYRQRKYYRRSNWLLGNADQIRLSAVRPMARTSDDILSYFLRKGRKSYVCDMTPSLNTSASIVNNIKVFRVLIEDAVTISFGYGMEPYLTPLLQNKKYHIKNGNALFPHLFP
jgi:ribosomal protein S12 methylthiotransferase accessory factor